MSIKLYTQYPHKILFLNNIKFKAFGYYKFIKIKE